MATRRGGPEVLAIRDVPRPRPAAQQVVVEVAAAGVAFGDLALREGLNRVDGGLRIPGYDVAGRVTEVGSDVTDVRVGDYVAAWTGGSGGYSTHVALAAWAAMPYPEHLAVTQVTALVLNYLAALQLLSRTVTLPPGSRILVHSAAGGVGSALLQLAHLRGLQVIGSASTGKADLVRRTGATFVDYRTEDVALRVRELAPDGVDAVFDPLGARSWRRSLTLLRPGGHLVPYGVTSAFRGGRRSLLSLAANVAFTPRPSVLRLFTRGVGVSGYASGAMFEAHRQWYREDLASLVTALAEGRIDSLIHRSYPLEEAAAAQQELGRGGTQGKITLIPGL